MTVSPTLYDVAALREHEFPVSQTLTYLNHASISPIPRRSLDSIHSTIDQLGTNPIGFFTQQLPDMFAHFGQIVADYIHANDALEICPITSTSLGMNLVANAIDWQSGDNIILCDLE